MGQSVMIEFLKQLEDDICGATAIEYGLTIALMFLAIIVSVRSFGEEAIEMWDKISSTSTEAINAKTASD